MDVTDHKESWAPKNWCAWIVALEKALESPLDSPEIQPVHLKGDQSWVFIGRTDVLWPPDAKSWLIWKDPNAEKYRGQEEKGTTEDEMVGWHHWLNGHEFGWALGVGVGQGGLACCSSWVRKESDMTERLNWTQESYIAGIIQYVPVWDWLLPLGIMSLRSIQVVVCIKRLFFFTAEYYSTVWIYCSLFSQSPIAGHFGYFQFLTIADKIAINNCVQVFMWT